MLDIRPNPTRGAAVVRLTTRPQDHSTTLLRVFDATGRLVLSQMAGKERQASSVVLDLTPLPTGVYLLDVSGAVNGTAIINRLPE